MVASQVENRESAQLLVTRYGSVVSLCVYLPLFEWMVPDFDNFGLFQEQLLVDARHEGMDDLVEYVQICQQLVNLDTFCLKFMGV